MQTETNEVARFNPFEDDVLAISFANKDLIDLEPGLFQTKWFDYRMITPASATRLYMDAYHDVYKRIYADEVDRTVAEYIKPLSADSVIEGLASEEGSVKQKKAKRQFAACWRGRQVADAVGMPYREYVDVVMRRRLRFWSSKHLPQPQHLYHQFDVEYAMQRWSEMQSGRLYLADHDAYIVQNYQGIHHQDDYHEWLFAQAALRSNPAYQIAQFVNEDRLPLSKVESRLGDEDLELVRRHLT